MGKWDDDYKEGDDYLGYDRDAASRQENPTELAADPYAVGVSPLKLVQRLLPPEFKTYAHLAVAGVRDRVGWLTGDQRRDALGIASKALWKAATNRKPEYSEAQFCSYLKKSISGELLRNYEHEIAYRSGDPEVIERFMDRRSSRTEALITIPRTEPLDTEPGKRAIVAESKKGKFAGYLGLLPSRLREIVTRRADGETLQSIGDTMGISAQRVRELELRADGMLSEKLLRVKKGESLGSLVRETVISDPASKGLSQSQIDDKIRAFDTGPTVTEESSYSGYSGSGSYSIADDTYDGTGYDPEHDGDPEAEGDCQAYEIDLDDEQFEDSSTEGMDEESGFYDDWQYDDAIARDAVGLPFKNSN